MEKSFLLSSAGLSRNVLQSDFTFYVGGHEYYTNKSNASFISESVSDMLRLDPTFDHYVLEIDDSHYEFNIIMRLMVGQPIKITPIVIKYLLNVFQKLKNHEVIDHFNEIKNSKLTKETALASFITRINYGQSVTNEIEFIASNFSSFVDDLKEDFYFDYIESIISSPSLVLDNEDSLFNFLKDLGKNFYYLFSYVNFQFLSESSIDDFFKNFPYNKMTNGIWESLYRYFKYINSDDSDHSNQRFTSKEFPLKNNPFDGIFAYFCEQCKGNPHLKGLLTVSSSSSSSNNNYDVIDNKFDGYWFTANESNSWIMFDFKDKVLQLTDYAIKSDGNGANHLQNWVIEGSNDSKNWYLLDKRITKALCQNYVTETFQCSLKKSNGYRFIRLRQTGQNSNFLNYLMISSIEFFGKLDFVGQKKKKI